MDIIRDIWEILRADPGFLNTTFVMGTFSLYIHPGRLTAGTHSHHPFRKENDLNQTSMNYVSYFNRQGPVYLLGCLTGRCGGGGRCEGRGEISLRLSVGRLMRLRYYLVGSYQF